MDWNIVPTLRWASMVWNTAGLLFSIRAVLPRRSSLPTSSMPVITVDLDVATFGCRDVGWYCWWESICADEAAVAVPSGLSLSHSLDIMYSIRPFVTRGWERACLKWIPVTVDQHVECMWNKRSATTSVNNRRDIFAILRICIYLSVSGKKSNLSDTQKPTFDGASRHAPHLPTQHTFMTTKLYHCGVRSTCDATFRNIEYHIIKLYGYHPVIWPN